MEEKSYYHKNKEFIGCLTFDKDVDKKRPGILVFPEWWGLNEYIQKRTKFLAELGYVAFGVDVYGGGEKTNSPDEAASLMKSVIGDKNTVMDRVNLAHKFLLNCSICDHKKICAIGYCFGGALVLNMARFGINLKAVVSFHGALDPIHLAIPGQIKAKVLVCHGAEDKLISQESIEKFKSEMNFAKANYEFITYEGAQHGFSNTGSDEKGKKFDLPLAYNENADKKSWEAMKKLFEEVL